MEGLRHDKGFLAAKGFLIVRCPSIEDISDVWQEKTVIISFGTFKNFEELACNFRYSRNTSVCWASKDKKDILACFHQNLVLFIAVATAGCHFWEHTSVEGLAAAIKDTNDVAVVFLAQSS